MKAVVVTKYGPPEVLQMKEVEKPTPKDNEVLIKICATTAHFGDTRIRRSVPFLVIRLIFGFFKPKKNLILGVEVSGVIEAIGKNVTLFKEGDKVFGLTGYRLGAYAEYCCLPEKVKDGTQENKGVIIKLPSNLSLKEAPAVPSGALTVIKNLQKAKIKNGHEILINGASGSLGTYAIQLAKHYGATVTAVCSEKNFELVKSLGADKVLDYTKEEFTNRPERYDIVYDAVMKSTRGKCKKILKKNGTFLNNYWLSSIKEADVSIMIGFIENNTIKPIIDRTYPLSEIVEAHRYVDTERKRGNVIITIQD
ncbi:Alcohol dehydrogenase [Kordia antarctica]|uniref:Alcohol dehydrogenase n=1 Tax=Kordia antarctica TaxID=1218801 RepID=A0A7L4ZHM5_9FLAO|nr:NAD(P)-dependent alcohol dehydrogenase [Kordia antarctica]QHI36105.1 Alcohol dehydrogenase [Kordia antarctica]